MQKNCKILTTIKHHSVLQTQHTSELMCKRNTFHRAIPITILTALLHRMKDVAYSMCGIQELYLKEQTFLLKF